jgi:omega-amidase
MRITIVQPQSIWEDKSANFCNIENLVSKVKMKTDLIVLPEMFSTGFTLNAEKFGEELHGETFNWMLSLSKKGNFAVCGSFILRSDNKYYNHFAFVSSQNESFSYDKRHLFNMAGENEIFSKGCTRNVFTFKGMRFLPIICYDLRFPVWIRNRSDYDAIICVASWPDVRREAWKSLLKARAIENQAYVIGVNRTGTDNDGLKYAGDSAILDPHGNILGKVCEYEEGLDTAEISLTEVQEFRKKFPVWKDSDDFTLNN